MSDGNPMYTFGMMAVIFAIFWFLIIRPQQKQQKKKKQLHLSFSHFP